MRSPSPPDRITIAGKAPPEPVELERAAGRGFDVIELYLEREHLKDVEQSVAIVRDAAVDAISVHTPHVPIEEPEWLRRADRLASRLDAHLVVHSNRIIHTFVSELEDLDFQAPYGYENNPGVSERHLQSMILEPGYEFVLDTAHLYMAEEDYVAATERLLTEFGDQIPVLHLCDSTLTEDGLGFGAGSMDMAAVSNVVRQEFEGKLILEVMPEHQEEAKDLLETYWEE